MQRLSRFSSFYLFIGLALGIFYREFTKFNGFKGETTLGLVHAHTLMLGFVFFMIVLLLEKNFKISDSKNFKVWLITYNVGLMYLISMLVFRGVLQVQGSDFNGLSHMAGLGHAILGISLIWFSVIVNKSVKNYENKSDIKNS